MQTISNLIPLFWVKGESSEILLDGLAKLREAGISECIIEARPFPDWLEEPWFATLRTLFAEAQRTGMRLWLFDDSHFPSGGADGRLAEVHKKKLLRCQTVELPGPGNYRISVPCGKDESLFQAVLASYLPPDGFDGASARQIPLPQNGGDVNIEVTASGRHRLFLLIRTREFGEDYTREWVNMLSSEAVREFIRIVYERHYHELKEYFDSGVMAGFFSDEPRFGSAPSYDSLPDGKSRSLPFSEELAAELADQCAAFWPSLWHEAGESTPQFRSRYMDAVSTCYSRAFPQQIGQWCRTHGVQYIGHTIEDNGAHARIGYGTGHYFRTMTGQDMAAVDSVLHQNLPGVTEGIHETSFGKYDSAFFHWGLGKLAASAAHLMPEFHGRAGCECFGAYGWNFGLTQMKWMTDHFAVRGINCFLPHAFSNAPFPDPDCPPHFYARGNNPQWPWFPIWSQYCNRLCNLLLDGIHLSGTAVLYHAEAEWSTRQFTPFHAIGAELLKRQLDFDVVPFDLLVDAVVENGVMTIHGEKFFQLAVPEYAFLEPEKIAVLNRLKTMGLPVLSCIAEILAVARENQPYPVISQNPALMVYRYQTGEEVRLFLVNESQTETAGFRLPPGGSCLYDPLTDMRYQWQDEGILAPGESLLAFYNVPVDSVLPEFPGGKLQPVTAEIFCGDNDSEWYCTIPESLQDATLYLDAGPADGVVILTWNDVELTPRIAPPYQWKLPDIKRKNTFSIAVVPSVAPEYGGIFDRGIARRKISLQPCIGILPDSQFRMESPQLN